MIFLTVILVDKGHTIMTTATATFNRKRRLPWRTDCVRKRWKKLSDRITSPQVQMHSSGSARMHPLRQRTSYSGDLPGECVCCNRI